VSGARQVLNALAEHGAKVIVRGYQLRLIKPVGMVCRHR
jgi:hypothetical protein